MTDICQDIIAPFSVFLSIQALLQQSLRHAILNFLARPSFFPPTRSVRAALLIFAGFQTLLIFRFRWVGWQASWHSLISNKVLTFDSVSALLYTLLVLLDSISTASMAWFVARTWTNLHLLVAYKFQRPKVENQPCFTHSFKSMFCNYAISQLNN